MRSPFCRFIKNPALLPPMAADPVYTGSPYIKTLCLMPEEGAHRREHRESLTSRELSDTIHRPASSWIDMP
jgi:hypothetical protein